MAAVQKPFHVVVWGASGFTGRLVAEHIARDYKGQIKWAMAGRNKERLEQVRLELSKTYGEDIKDIPILLGDLSDQSSLDAIARDTRVMISTAGPFVRLGQPVVDAAVRMGSHYVDITGESSYVMHLIRTYNEQAAATNLRIVPCCGYDSIPSDLGALLVVDYMKHELGKQTAKVVMSAKGKGGVSGGTIASGMEQQEGAKARGMPADTGVYSHLPEGAPRGEDKEFWGVEWEPTLKTWLAPFVMQVINNRVVHRSAALLGWGPQFKYQECSPAKSWFAAKAMAWGTAAVLGALSQKWMQPLLKKIVPAPGEGPSREAMMSGFFVHKVVGYSQEEGGAKPVAVVGEVADRNRDPGYWGTSRMLLEAGLCLALQQAELDANKELLHGGVLTPATAMGTVLMDRLRKAGLEFEIKEVIKPE